MLRYGLSCSLDGYVVDGDGNFDWSEPSEDAHAYFNARTREVSTFVLGRRMWETMRVWDTMPAGESEVTDEFAAAWREIDKIVCSDTLTGLDAPRATLEPRLTAERLAEIVAASDGVVEVSGPTTAAVALRAGMVDEMDVRVLPYVAGSGVRLLPDGLRAELALVDTFVFDDGSVCLRYARSAAAG